MPKHKWSAKVVERELDKFLRKLKLHGIIYKTEGSAIICCATDFQVYMLEKGFNVDFTLLMHDMAVL